MKTILILCFTCLMLQSYCQGKKDDIVTNQTLVTLTKAGFGKDILISKIQTSKCSFDLSLDSLLYLKKTGLPDEVITAMINANGNSNSSKKETDNETITDTKPDNQQSGIYYCKGNPCSMVQIDASLYSQGKMGSGLAARLTYGIAKTKAKATLSGDRANMQINEYEPVFYFYFDKSSNASLGNNGVQNYWFGSASTPNEFILVKFSVNKSSREVTTGSFGTYSGISSGIEEKFKIPFTYEKTASGVYKVYAKKPLEEGQYCFMYAGGTGMMSGTAPLQKVYDFGVK